MKRLTKRILCLCTALLLLIPLASAKAGMDAAVHTYRDDAPLVDTAAIFKSVYETEKDIEIRGERASWYFYYENIYRSTEKWKAFSASVGVGGNAPAALAETLGDRTAFFVDFRDGDRYPGPAEITVQMADVLGTLRGPFLLYAYDETEDGVPVLEPVAEHLMLAEDGVFRITVDQAQDYLLIAADEASKALEAFYRQITVKEEEFFSGAAVGWIVFFVLVGLALAGFVIYLVTVKIMKMKRRGKASAGRKNNKK